VSAPIETPEAMAEIVLLDVEVEDIIGDTSGTFARAIRADREAIRGVLLAEAGTARCGCGTERCPCRRAALCDFAAKLGGGS
jgi:hypothetical protein